VSIVPDGSVRFLFELYFFAADPRSTTPATPAISQESEELQ